MSRYIYANLFLKNGDEFEPLQIKISDKTLDVYVSQSVGLEAYESFKDKNPEMPIFYKEKQIDNFHRDNKEFIPFNEFMFFAKKMMHCGLPVESYTKTIENGLFYYDGIGAFGPISMPELLCLKNNTKTIYYNDGELEEKTFLYAYIPENFEMYKIYLTLENWCFTLMEFDNLYVGFEGDI